MRALLVEDTPHFAELLSRTLQEAADGSLEIDLVRTPAGSTR
ncbi:MAG TPA: hypothetical protein VEZ46_16055 [Mycobacteriales bacterium]|jgi:hypothetical protein|nr:hypothetical protein [Mycobacteriales bacterium]